ncbi:MAG: tRNA threonylcarbamoyladenosine dehydratase [Prevotellaceae bacterium]|nr:tRNA threonylcarbamoyladenosine dehydratase [Prevotellaceae bacterium]
MECGDIFQRARALVGEELMVRLARCRVLLFGVGGVGSWCAEALVRSGVGCLTLVDPDIVVASNCNRQLPATSSTIGRAKAEVMRKRLLDINPRANVTALTLRYTAETAQDFHIEDYDIVVDAIDSLADKARLILHVTGAGSGRHCPVLLSSMGAARRLDPTRVRVAEFWHVQGDPLAALLRKRFRHEGTLPAREFRCVYSLEPALPAATGVDGKALNASLCHVTAVFGMTLAWEAIKAIRDRK